MILASRSVLIGLLALGLAACSQTPGPAPAVLLPPASPVASQTAAPDAGSAAAAPAASAAPGPAGQAAGAPTSAAAELNPFEAGNGVATDVDLLDAGRASGDVPPPRPAQRYVRTEWRTNTDEQGHVVTQWQVRITDTGEAVRWGVLRRYFASGALAMVGQYEDNQPVGVWRWLDEQGRVVRRARPEADYENDPHNNPLANPLSVITNTAGRPVAEGQLKYNKAHGTWQYFYDSGSPKAEGNYLSGVPNGVWNYFTPDGQVQRQVTFDMGVPDGPYRSAYPDGADQQVGQYSQGVRTGTWRLSYPNGQTQEEGAFVEDRRDGEWRFFDEDGTLRRRAVYRQGQVLRELPLPLKKVLPPDLIPDVNAPGRPQLFHDDGAPIQRHEDWEGAPPPAPPERRLTAPPRLSRWIAPTTSAAQSSGEGTP